MPAPRITAANASRLAHVSTVGRGTPFCAIFSPDGTRLAVAASCGVWLYQSDALDDEPRLFPSLTDCESVAFSPDSSTLAACCTGGQVLVWDVVTGKPKATLAEYPNVPWTIAFSPDGRYLAAAGQLSQIWIWSTDRFQLLHQPDHHHAGVSQIAYSPDGTLLASRGNDAVWLWDTATGRAQRLLPDISRLAFSPDGTILSLCGESLWHYHLATGRLETVSVDGETRLSHLAYSPDGTLLALSCRDNSIRLWDMAARRVKHTLVGHTGRIHSLNFSPDGEILASVGLDFSGTFGDGYDSSVRLWDAASGAFKRNLPGYDGMRLAFALHPNGTLMATGYQGLQVYDTAATPPTITHVAAPGVISGTAFSPDGQTLLTGSSEEFALRSVPDFRTRKTLNTPPGSVRTVGFSHDGQFAAAADGRHFVPLWNLQTGDALTIPPKPRRPAEMEDLAFCPTAPLLALSLSRVRVQIWHLPTLKRQIEFSPPSRFYRFAFSPDARHLATGHEQDTVVLHDITTGQPVNEFRIVTNRRWTAVLGLAFNADGTLLAFSASDGHIHLLDIAAWTEIARIPAQADRSYPLTFSADSRRLISLTGGIIHVLEVV